MARLRVNMTLPNYVTSIERKIEIFSISRAHCNKSPETSS